MEKRLVSLNVAVVIAGLDQLHTAPEMVNDILVAGGGIAIKSLNPAIADSLEMDLYRAASEICGKAPAESPENTDVQQMMGILAKVVVDLKPLLTDVNLEGQWTVTGKLTGENLELDLTEAEYVEPKRREMRRTKLDFTTLGLIEQTEAVHAILGGIEDRERFNKLLVASHTHFTNNGRHNPLAVARDIVGNFYASLIAIKGDAVQPLGLTEASTLNSYIYDFVGLLSVEVQKLSMAVAEEASAIVEAGNNVQILLLSHAGEELKDDYFEIVIEELTLV